MFDDAPVAPLRRISTVEAVANALRALILDGDLPPGTQLREVELARSYGVARHGVRSALHNLVQEGLLRHHANRGVFVPQLTEEDVADLHTLRCAVECEAVARLAKTGHSLDGVYRALATLEQIAADAPWRDLIMADLAIHRTVVDTVGSPRLTRVHASLIGELRLGLAALAEKAEKRRTMVPEHQALIAAIAGRCPEQATQLLRAHLAQAALDLAQAVAPSTDPEPLTHSGTAASLLLAES